MNYGNFCFWSYRVPRSKPRLGKINRHSLIVNWSDESFQNFIALVLFFRSKGGGGGEEGGEEGWGSDVKVVKNNHIGDMRLIHTRGYPLPK